MKLRKVAMTEVLELHVFRIELLMQRVPGKINPVIIQVYNGNIHLREEGRGSNNCSGLSILRFVWM